ncbi:MAG: hypothetical protein ACI837_001557 [Crocinitomicaceae bacterium]|jgi:hypothetical protein
MEEKDDILDINEFNNNGAKRPSFITVLCILSFVGTGIGLLAGLFSILIVSGAESSFDRLGDLYGDSSYSSGMDEYYRWTKISNYLGLLGNAMCLTGALIMWNLKKVGYFIYIPGQIIPFFGAVMVYSSTSFGFGGGGMFENLGMIGLVLGALFPLAFIVMYGVNLKHMK